MLCPIFISCKLNIFQRSPIRGFAKYLLVASRSYKVQKYLGKKNKKSLENKISDLK